MDYRVVKFNRSEAIVIEPGKPIQHYPDLSNQEFNDFMGLYKSCPNRMEIFWNGEPSFMYFWY